MWIEVRRGGALVGERPVSAAACVEDALFYGVVAGRIANDGVAPRFAIHAERDSASAVTALVLSHPDLPPRRYERAVFTAQAHHLIRALVAEGRLEAGTVVEWQLANRKAVCGSPARVSRAPFALIPGALPRRSERLGFEVDGRVLEAIQMRVARAGTVECAGLLLGSLLHDAAQGCALVRITDQVELAPGTRGASDVHFALDPALLVAARREAARRGNGLL